MELLGGEVGSEKHAKPKEKKLTSYEEFGMRFSMTKLVSLMSSTSTLSEGSSGVILMYVICKKMIV